MNPAQPTRPFTRVLYVLAALVVALAGMGAAAPFLNPILFALVFSVLFSPIYAWLRRRNLPVGVALLLVLVVQLAVFGTLFYVLAVSLGEFTAQLGTYAT